MAQNYLSIAATDTLNASRDRLTDRDDAAASSFSGTGFPTTNLLVGMRCHRTDLNKIYVLKDTTPTWIEVEDVSGTSGLAPRATVLATGRTFSISGDATAPAVTFTGAANVALALTLANSGVTAGTYTKVTVDAKGRVTVGAAITNSDLPTSGVTAGTFTKLTVNNRGIVTAGAAIASADLPQSPSLSGTITSAKQRLTDTGSMGLATDDHPFQIGATSGVNIIADRTGIQARSTGAVYDLTLNPLGGNIILGQSGTQITRVFGTLRVTDMKGPLGADDAKVNGDIPVAQGGGAGMMTNKVRLGWGSSGNLLVQVDSSPIGDVVRRVNGAVTGGNSEMIALGSAPLYAVRAWGEADANGNLFAGANIAAISGLNPTTVTFAVPMPDASYSVLVSGYGGETNTRYPHVRSKSTTGFTMANGGSTGGGMWFAVVR